MEGSNGVSNYVIQIQESENPNDDEDDRDYTTIRIYPRFHDSDHTYACLVDFKKEENTHLVSINEVNLHDNGLPEQSCQASKSPHLDAEVIQPDIDISAYSSFQEGREQPSEEKTTETHKDGDMDVDCLSEAIETKTRFNQLTADVEITPSEDVEPELDENFDIHPKCAARECRCGASGSVSMSNYNDEACCCDKVTKGGKSKEVIVPDKKKVKETSTLLDRYALFTDGKQCWNPPLFLKSNNHPIPGIEPPGQKFRYFHSNLLKSLVKEAITREIRSSIHASFEEDSLKLGIQVGDLKLFRKWDYDMDVINSTWFNDGSILKLPKAQRDIYIQRRPALRQILSKLKANLDNITSDVLEEKMLNPKLQVDWLFVSAQMLIRGSRNVSPEGCQRLWYNAFSPCLSMPTSWTQQEFSRLKALTMKPGKRNFVKIAKEMGPKFSPFLCLKMFVKYIRPTIEDLNDEDDKELNSVWKQDVVQRDFETCMEMYNGSYRCTALWLTHAYNVEFSEKFLSQQNEKYKIGPFSLHEDGILLVVDEIIQEHKLTLYTFQDFLPWRPEGAWNHRIDSIRFPHRTNSGGKNEWSEKEDRQLLELAKKHRKDWANIQKYFVCPKRSRKAVQSRHVLLTHALGKGTLEEFHANGRDVITARFYYMRKTLAFLEELDESRNSYETATEPDTTLVHKLFQSCNERFQKNFICLKPFSKSTWNLFPQTEQIRTLLLEIPRFYFQKAIGKMHTFFKAAGIPPTLPP